jgi:hypothetical protein
MCSSHAATEFLVVEPPLARLLGPDLVAGTGRKAMETAVLHS